MKPIALAICASFLALGLAGCETATSLFGSSGDTPSVAVSNPPPAAPAVSQQPAQIAIAPVIGPPETVSSGLTTRLAADLQTQSIRVANAGEAAAYTLRGYVVSSMDKAGTNAKISYIWDVTDASGKGVHRVSGEESTKVAGGSKDPWASVSPSVIQAISTKTAASITKWLPSQAPPIAAPAVATNTGSTPGLVKTAAVTPSTPPTASQPSTPAPSSAVNTGSIATPGAVLARVPSVTGAPGDGSSSLRRALQRELARKGVALADSPSPSTYTVEGKVALGSGSNGKQPITIDWNVLDPAGKKLGTVSQKNDVPQGSLDGAWGKTAEAAAAAAAQGIVKLLPQKMQTSSTN
jgi:hypothetical protein